MYELIRDIETFSEVSIRSDLKVFCDTETCQDEERTSGGLYGKVRLFQLFQQGWPNALLIDCMFVPLDSVLDLVKDHNLVFHNASYDLHTVNCYTEETWFPKSISDTVYLSRLKYYTKLKFDFYECLKYAGLEDDLIRSIDKKEQQKSDWSGPLSKTQLTYAAADVIYLADLYEAVKESESRLVYKVDIESLKLAVEYSRNGMPINREEVSRLQKKYMAELEDLLNKLPINPRSSKQACIFLGTKSSDSDTLTTLIQEGNERAEMVQSARHCYKSLEYLHSYDREVVRGFFNPCAALSGRFSCVGGDSYGHVNLQQMPEKLHSVVQAPEGFEIVYKDYSGLELRMSVAYTGEPTMSHLMKQGMDLHTETAKYLFNKDEVTDEERTVAKTFNFCLIYGGGVKTAQNTLAIDANVHLPFKRVKELREMWFDMYQYFGEWHQIHKNLMNIHGYVDVTTALGRKVRAYQLTDSLNIPIQGSSVEVTKMSLLLLKKKYPEAYIINTIHDANILLAKKEESDIWGQRLSDAMVEAWTYVTSDLAEPDIPMPGGFEHGPIWIFH